MASVTPERYQALKAKADQQIERRARLQAAFENATAAVDKAKASLAELNLTEHTAAGEISRLEELVSKNLDEVEAALGGGLG